KLAVRLGEQPVAPISVDPDGSATHGAVFDHVRLIALAARAAAAASTPLDPEKLPPEISPPRLVVVAYPATCEGKTIAPGEVTLADRNGSSPRLLSGAQSSDRSKATPGFDPPVGSIAVAYGTGALIDGARITIRYAEACGAADRELVLPVKSD